MYSVFDIHSSRLLTYNDLRFVLSKYTKHRRLQANCAHDRYSVTWGRNKSHRFFLFRGVSTARVNKLKDVPIEQFGSHN